MPEERLSFEKEPIDNPNLTPEENSRLDRLADAAGFPHGQAMRIVTGGAKKIRKTGARSSTKPARRFGPRQQMVADTPPQAHEAAMKQVREGAPADLNEEERLFGAEQARRMAERYKTGTEA